MKILYLCHDPIPSPETRTEQLVRTMAALAPYGIDSTLVVPAPLRRGRPEDRKAEIRQFYGLPADSAFPAEILEIVPWRGLGKRLMPVAHDLRAVRRAHSLSHDLLYTRDEIAMMLAVRSGLPTIFETYRADLNLLKRSWPLRRLSYSSPNLLGVVAHSRYARKSFLGAGLEPERVHLGYNGFDPRAVEPSLSQATARARLGLPDASTIVVYAGHVDARKGTSILLPIAARLPEVLFLVVGAVPGSCGERELTRHMQQLGVRNVQVVRWVSPPEVPAFVYDADCAIIPPTSAPLHRHRRTVLPMKTFTYMACGRPILAPDLPDVRELLTDDRNAVLVRPDRPDEAAEALRLLLHSPERASRLAGQAIADSKRYTWTARAEELAAFLRERLRGRRRGVGETEGVRARFW